MPQNPYQLALEGLGRAIPNSRLVPKKVLEEQDPSVGAYNFDNAMADEAALAAEQYTGLGNPNKASEFGQRAARYRGYAAASPITQQKGLTDSFNQQNIQAAHEGFGSMGLDPVSSGQSAMQSREIYKRKQAEENSASNVENIRGQWDVKQQEEMSRGLRGQAEVGANVKAQGFDILSSMLQGGQLKPGQRISIPSVGSINEPVADTPPNAAFADIRQARTNLEAARVRARGLFSRDETPIWEKALDDAVNGYLGQLTTADDGTKQAALRIYNDIKTTKNPEVADATSDELIPLYQAQLGGIDPATLTSILATIRGK